LWVHYPDADITLIGNEHLARAPDHEIELAASGKNKKSKRTTSALKPLFIFVLSF